MGLRETHPGIPTFHPKEICREAVGYYGSFTRSSPSSFLLGETCNGNMPFSCGKIWRKAEWLGTPFWEGGVFSCCTLKYITLCSCDQLCPMEMPNPSPSWVSPSTFPGPSQLQNSAPMSDSSPGSVSSPHDTGCPGWSCMWSQGWSTEAPFPCQLIPCLPCKQHHLFHLLWDARVWQEETSCWCFLHVPLHLHRLKAGDESQLPHIQVHLRFQLATW